MNNGWIKLHRKLLENPVVMRDSEYFAIWIYLLLNATHERHPAMFKGEKIMLEPGQLITGRKTMSKELNISESKIYRVLNCYKSEQQIEQQTSNKNSLITVLNWHLYQLSEQQNEQLLNIKRTATEHKQECKNVRNSVGVDVNNAIAQELAYELLPKYWNREPTENDIELVKNRIFIIVNHNIVADETKVEFLKYAFEQSGFANKMSWQYINGVFKRLANRGINTVDKLMDFEIKENRK